MLTTGLKFLAVIATGAALGLGTSHATNGTAQSGCCCGAKCECVVCDCDSQCGDTCTCASCTCCEK